MAFNDNKTNELNTFVLSGFTAQDLRDKGEQYAIDRIAQLISEGANPEIIEMHGGPIIDAGIAKAQQMQAAPAEKAEYDAQQTADMNEYLDGGHLLKDEPTTIFEKIYNWIMNGADPALAKQYKQASIVDAVKQAETDLGKQPDTQKEAPKTRKSALKRPTGATARESREYDPDATRELAEYLEAASKSANIDSDKIVGLLDRGADPVEILAREETHFQFILKNYKTHKMAEQFISERDFDDSKYNSQQTEALRQCINDFDPLMDNPQRAMQDITRYIKRGANPKVAIECKNSDFAEAAMDQVRLQEVKAQQSQTEHAGKTPKQTKLRFAETSEQKEFHRPTGALHEDTQEVDTKTEALGRQKNRGRMLTHAEKEEMRKAQYADAQKDGGIGGR